MGLQHHWKWAVKITAEKGWGGVVSQKGGRTRQNGSKASNSGCMISGFLKKYCKKAIFTLCGGKSYDIGG